MSFNIERGWGLSGVKAGAVDRESEFGGYYLTYWGLRKGDVCVVVYLIFDPYASIGLYRLKRCCGRVPYFLL